MAADQSSSPPGGNSKPAPKPGAPPAQQPANPAAAPQQRPAQPAPGATQVGQQAGRQPVAPQKGRPNPFKQPSTRVTLSKGRAKVGVNFKAQERQQEEQKKAVEEREAAIPLEQRVFAIPGMKEVQEPQIFVDFLEKMAPKLSLADTSWNILEAFSNIDVTAERVSKIINANPYYEYLFLKVTEQLAKREEMPSLEGAVVLMGMQNFRNLVIALQMSRSVLGSHAEWDKDGKLKANPSEILKYAIRTEELLVSTQSEYSDTGYAAGLVFDVFALIATATAGDKKKALAFIDTVYSHGLRAAQVGTEIAKLIPDFGFKKYIFSVCLLHDIGKVALSLLSPDYPTFVEDGRKREWPRTIRHFIEAQKYGIDHAVLGSLICSYFKMFRPVEKAIHYHHEPHLLKGRNKSLFPLVSLVTLATNISNNFRKTDRADDPIVSQWRGVELRDFNIDMKSVMQAVAKAASV